MPADALLPYRINFENLGPGSKDENGDPYTVFATAPAQRVTISDQLEAALDWNSFEITEFGWGDTLINVPPGTSHFTDTVRMTQGDKVFNVEIAAGIDFSLGRIFVRFQSMDLESGLPPDVLTGFLPPEDGTGIGMGHFAYTIRTKPSLPAGTEIRNVALITFDLNESISTDQIDPQDPAQGIDPDRQALVTLDPDKPTSTIDVLNVTSRTSSFLVGWAGSDVGAGIHGYDIYVSDNGGPWQIWLSGTTETSATFEGEFGHSYGFLSVARDQAGNVQERGNTAQATVVVAPADGRSEKVVQSPDQEFGVSSATPIDDWAADWDVAKVAIYDGLLRDQTDGTTLLGGIDRMLVSPPRVGASNGGLVSATIRVKGRSFKVRGGFDSQGLFDQDFIQKDGTTLSIDLRLMETESGNEAIRGTISWNGTIAQADLPRAPYSKANPAPAGLVGAYTVVFPSQTNWGFDQPGGDGWALASVSQAGVIAIKGVLGDGTPFSDLAFLSADADASVYTELYRTTPERGRFGGKIVFRDQPNISDFDGVMQWKKFADSRDLRYPNGFDVDVWALGSRFVVPQAPTSRVLSSLADQHHNAEISFFGPTAPGNDPAGLDRVVSWLANNRLVHYGPERLGATASPRNGLLVGAFLDASTGVRVKFSGVAYQKQGFAAGVFVNGTASGAIRVVPGTAFSYPGSEDAGALSRIDPPSTPTDGPVEMDQLAFVSEASGIYAGVVLDPGSEEAIGAIEGFKLDGNGGFSGALWFQGKRHGFKGLGFGTEIEIPRINQDSIFLTITLTRIEGSGDGFGLGGVIKINGSMVGTPDGQRMPRFTKIDRSPQEGSYTASMRAPDNVDPSIEPGGDGSATFSVSYLGIINGLVTLPEGTRVSMGGHVGRSYGAPDATFAEWSFHRGLYGKIPRGYLAGKLFFNRANGASITDLDGRWHWVKESGIASASSYPGGFDITRDVIGGTYTIPAKGVRAMAGLDDDWWNLWLRFVGPDLSNLDTLTLESNDLAATWTTGNRVLYFGPEVIRIDFDARTGRLAGSYIDKPSGVSVRFGGVLLQTQSRVGGSYITNGSNGPISGLFIANPR